MQTAILAKAENGERTVLQPVPSSGEASDSTLVVVREHELIFAEGDAAQQRYDIVDGAVMLFRVLPDGRRQLVELLGPGDMFGLTCAPEYDCSAETLVSTRLRISHRLDCSQVPPTICKMCRQLRSTWHDAWSAPGAPESLQMPLQGVIAIPALNKAEQAADKGSEKAREMVSYYVGQGVGLIDAIRTTSAVVQDFKEEFADALEAMNSLLQ